MVSVLREAAEEIVMTAPLDPFDMRYSSCASHLSPCPHSTLSRTRSAGGDKVETRSRKAGSQQQDSDCPDHHRCTQSPDFCSDARIRSSTADERSGAVPAKHNPHHKLAGCSCGPSDCDPTLSQDSGYQSQDSGYFSLLNQSPLPVEDKGNLVLDDDHRTRDPPEGQACDGEQPQEWTSGDEEDSAVVVPTHSVVEGPRLEAKPVSPRKKQLAFAKWQLLPALQVGWAVCQSMGRVKGRLSVDKSLLKETLQGQVFSIENLIGRKMGLEYVDIWKELSVRGFPELLKKMLRLLSGVDLLNCVKVSKTWRRIIFDDKTASQILKSSRLRRISAADLLSDAGTRRNTVSRGVLSSVQCVGLHSSQKSSTQPSSPAKLSSASQKSIRHQQLVKTLKWDETLKTCPMCASSAKYLPSQQRAICSRENCSYDYCSLCFCAFHGSKDCGSRHFKNSSKIQPQAGSKKSKRNLKRL
ncbi:F-box only protein 5-like isoform X2 [Heterodontus francisci]|uniref:F-box only protein 5-like isoform X2 n=1 Tax=Heterodontus francisci TaxID=7792 RepID=UPI00355C1831